MRFEFATATRIVFGRGKLADLPAMLGPFGRRALVVTGRHSARASGLIEGLRSARIESTVFAVPSEPTIDLVRAGAQIAKTCTMVIGFGGGSAIDAAKAIAALAPNTGEPLDYLEIVGKGQTLERDSLPFIAIPTTAGTGAEVTRNAVIDSPEHGVKASLRSSSMLAKIALVDPELTLDLPSGITASTGLDALTQLIEAYVSCKANPMTDLFCLEGVKSARNSIREAWQDGGKITAREDMAWAALLSGLALANAGLGAVHGFAGPLGGLLHAPHGSLCAAMLPHVMATNISALRERDPQGEALARYRRIACVLTGHPGAPPEDGAGWVADLCNSLPIQPLRAHGLRPEQIPDLVAKAEKASSMRGNPLPLTKQELTLIIQRAL